MARSSRTVVRKKTANTQTKRKTARSKKQTHQKRPCLQNATNHKRSAKKGDTEERLIHTDREKSKVQKVVVFFTTAEIKKIHAAVYAQAEIRDFTLFF